MLSQQASQTQALLSFGLYGYSSPSITCSLVKICISVVFVRMSLMLPFWVRCSAATFLHWIPFTYPGERAAVVGLFLQLQHGLHFNKSQPEPNNNATHKALTCTMQAAMKAQNPAKDEKENIVGFCKLSFTWKCCSSLYSLDFLEVMTIAAGCVQLSLNHNDLLGAPMSVQNLFTSVMMRPNTNPCSSATICSLLTQRLGRTRWGSIPEQ